MSTEEKRRFNASLRPEELAARAHASVQRKQQADAEAFKKVQVRFKKIKKLQEEAASLFDDPLWDTKEKLDAENQWHEEHDWKFNWERELRMLVARPLSEVEISALKKRFGGDVECLYNLRMYAARITKGETMCIVPPDAHLRPRFEVLCKGGLAEVYERFLPDLLDVLTLPQLRLVGKSAGLDKLGRDKASSCALLRVLPEKTLALAWTATEIDFHDVYHLKMIN